jgi:hypothetical protein
MGSFSTDPASLAWQVMFALPPESGPEARRGRPRNDGNQASFALDQPLFRHLMQRTAIDLVG